ncbi:MAG TPA: S8 family peptidase [Candidatus Limnocylindrales bacterium]
MVKRLAVAGANGQQLPINFGISWFGVSWDFAVQIALSAAIVMTTALPVARLVGTAGSQMQVIVREMDGAGNGPERLVRQLGGTINFKLPLIGGFSASIPASAIDAVAAGHGIAAVTPDGEVHFNSVGDSYDASSTMGSLYNTARAIGATDLWRRGITGRGVDVAVIDTGVSPDPDFAGRLINGPDLSFDSQSATTRYVDGYGHGTHMASIIAARDPQAGSNDQLADPAYFVGMAPAARIVNVKVGAANGVTDVSQVIAAVDWVVQHHDDDGLNIRVLNLSFGTNGTQSYVLDPLTYAVERAWFAGIVVVASAGNEGYGSNKLDDPAYDPFVIAVGSDDLNGTLDVSDDQVSDFSNRGTSSRRPDLVAPGQSIVGLRVPGSYIDMKHPEGRVGDSYFKGTGTSQATAVVSGAVALLLSARPSLTPSQAKAVLTGTADELSSDNTSGAGAGRVDVSRALTAPTAFARASFLSYPRATGRGLLQLSRGSAIVADSHGIPLVGEQDIFGHPYSVSTSGSSWSGGVWNGNSWSGNSWSGNSWSGNSWSAVTWTGNSWSGNSWSDLAWLGNSWSGNSWSGSSWSGLFYSMAGMGGSNGP